MRTQLASAAMVLNPKYLSIVDMSTYNTDIPVTNAMYRITLPNFNKYVDVAYTPGTMLHINSNLLMLTNTADPDQLCELPDGLYKIRQSVCPNDQLYFEYVFFKVDSAMSEVKGLVCEAVCDSDMTDKAYEIKKSLDIAKILAESCNAKEGIALFNSAVRELNLLKNCC